MLSYVQAFRDRHGTMRHYFRKPGCKRLPLPGLPGSAEFMAAYQAALGAAPKPVAMERSKPGTLGALVAAYYTSPSFTERRGSTQRGYKVSLEPFREKWGAYPVRGMIAADVRSILDGVKGEASRENLRKRLRQILQFGLERGWCDSNPVLALERDTKRKVAGFIPWSEDEITAYEARWPSGSRERLAMALLLYTGQRRSDVVSMGRQHVRDGRIHVSQLKTDKRLAIRIHPALQVELDAAPQGQMTFVQTEYGKPFSAAGFTGWFVGRSIKAGIVGRSPHGLRKAAGRRLAEAGCSAHEIMAILGHDSLQEAERYTRDADQARLGDAAIAALVRAEG